MTRMLVTRPEPDARDTAARLRALDIEPVVLPLLTHRTLETGLPEAAGFAAMALTSASALRALEERGALAAYRGLKVYAVGDRTAEAARAAGFANITSAGGALHDLAGLLAHSGLGGPIFYPAARHTSGDLAKSLAPFGVMVVTARVYDMEPARDLPDDVLAALAGGDITAVLFYSRRTAETFVACAVDYHLPRAVKTRLAMLCLSEQVAEPLVAARFVRVGLADHPSEEAMMALCLSFAREQNAS
jgi:uroporphyrinogen-III synthase